MVAVRGRNRGREWGPVEKGHGRVNRKEIEIREYGRRVRDRWGVVGSGNGRWNFSYNRLLRGRSGAYLTNSLSIQTGFNGR